MEGEYGSRRHGPAVDGGGDGARGGPEHGEIDRGDAVGVDTQSRANARALEHCGIV
jgi:hypothetical protein